MIVGTEIVLGSKVMLTTDDGSAYGKFAGWGKCVAVHDDYKLISTDLQEGDFQVIGVETEGVTNRWM